MALTTTTTNSATAAATMTDIDPLLIDVPERLETERLILRCLQPGDGAVVNAGVSSSLDALRPFMPWAQTAPSLGFVAAYSSTTARWSGSSSSVRRSPAAA